MGRQAYRGPRAVIREHAPNARDLPTALSAPRRGERGQKGPQPHQVEGAGQGRALLWRDQAGIRFRESPTPRAEQEREPAVCGLRAEQSVHRAPSITAPSRGVVRPTRRQELKKPRGLARVSPSWCKWDDPDRQKQVDQRFPKANRKLARTYDRDIDKERHLIENFFAKLKQFRPIATRYDKTAQNFLAGIHLTASAIWPN